MQLNSTKPFSYEITPTNGLVAYFSMEIAIDRRIPTYSGGLGMLAGDTLRAAVRSMASRDELVLRDSFANSLVFAPAASSRVSSQHPAHQ